ncbi:MAG: GNAT family N-acetyltransferase, partial [Planctomycetaceae bacterium]
AACPAEDLPVPSDVLRIRSPRTPCERIDAFRCLLGGGPDRQSDAQASDAIAWAAFHSIDLDGLVAAWSDVRPVAAALFCIAPDGSAYVWPPNVSSNAVATDTLLSGLLEAVTARADAAGCRTALAAISPDRDDQRRALLTAGFHWTSDVCTFRRTLDRIVPSIQKRNATFVPYELATAARFDDVIDRTLVDCRLEKIRQSARDLRAAYRASGDGRTCDWSLITVDGDDLAVALVNGRPEDRAKEIAYLGVVPEARRKGIAREIVASILEKAVADGCESLVATAESANAAAVSLYTQLGFVAIDRKAGFVRRRRAVDQFGDRAGSSDLH